MNVALRVIVAPHPDDEGQAFCFLEEIERLAAVVTLTHGEATNRMPRPEHQNLEAHLHQVARARISSWQNFLNDALGTAEVTEAADELPAGLAWRDKPARYAFDGGDGRLNSSTIRMFIDAVLTDLAAADPIEIILCAYHYHEYAHRDHQRLAESAQLIASDRRVARVLVRVADGSFKKAASKKFYEQMMGALGSFQSSYGWLAPNRTGWQIREEGGLFPRVSGFNIYESDMP